MEVVDRRAEIERLFADSEEWPIVHIEDEALVGEREVLELDAEEVLSRGGGDCVVLADKLTFEDEGFGTLGHEGGEEGEWWAAGEVWLGRLRHVCDCGG